MSLPSLHADECAIIEVIGKRARPALVAIVRGRSTVSGRCGHTGRAAPTD